MKKEQYCKQDLFKDNVIATIACTMEIYFTTKFVVRMN